MPVKKTVTEDKKPIEPITAMLGFLRLLDEISVSPQTREFCTPGHKAGRGFAAIFSETTLTWQFVEEAHHEV